MTNQNNTLVPVNKGVVQTTCHTILTEIEATRKKLFAQEVEKHIKPPTRFRKGRTREEAEQFVLNDVDELGYQGEWSYWNCGGEKLAKKLLAACEICENDIMYLDLETADFIASWAQHPK